MTIHPEDLPPSYYQLPMESQLRILDIVEYAETLGLTPAQYLELAMWFKQEAEMGR